MSMKRIKELQAKMNEKVEIKAGDIVQWKDGLKNRRWPEYGEQVLVVEVKETPLYRTHNDSGLPSFGEPLDLVLARLDSDGDFLHYHVDSRRFELAM